MQQPATDAELVDALSRRLQSLPPPPPSQPFTVHDVDIFHPELKHPSSLYDEYGGGECVYFFSNMFIYQDGWKVAAGTQPVLDAAGGKEVGTKDTLVFHEGGGRWLPRTRWAMDEFMAQGFECYLNSSLRLYRLCRLP